MDEKDKREYDAWASLRDHAWCEFEEKTHLEWRLSFGIWVALLASAGAILSASTLKGSTDIEIFAWVGVFVVAIVHARFLWWIQRSVRTSREFQREAEAEMRRLLHTAPVTLSPRKSAWLQPSVLVQMLITVLASITLLLVVHALPNG